MTRNTRKKEPKPLTEDELAEIAYQKAIRQARMRKKINDFFSDENDFRNEVVLIQWGLSRDTLESAMSDYLELVYDSVCKEMKIREHQLHIEEIREYLDDAPL